MCHVILRKNLDQTNLGGLNSSSDRTEKQTFCLCYFSLVRFSPGQALPVFPLAFSDECSLLCQPYRKRGPCFFDSSSPLFVLLEYISQMTVFQNNNIN